MNILNHILDQDIFFYGMFAGVVCHMSLFLLSVIQKEMTDQGVQTDALEELSDRPSQIIQDNLNSIETITPVTPTLEDTSAAIPSISQVGTSSTSQVGTSSTSQVGTSSTSQVGTPSTSQVGTPTIAEDINIEVAPNPDIVGRAIDPSNAEYIAAKVDQLNALDPFLATPWTPERVSAMIDSLSLLNDFM
jgi:hypothetical protein